ncbi:MAG: UTP--glucose-1-phosphate uridylyltransferase GalU [Bdellovibrionales bacterium]
MSQVVKKAIIPAAGLGTRFLPATKSVPKEMLNLVDAPTILYVVEEAVEAGIEDIVLIAGRGKHAIEDFFDMSYELEDKLAHAGKLNLLDRLLKIRNTANIISIRQKQALGLGHAVYCGRPVVGNEPFAVLLGDEITVSQNGKKTVTSQLCENFQNQGLSSVSIMEVPEKDVSKYGIAEVEKIEGHRYRIVGLVEKPKPTEVKSRIALAGRYVFESQIFEELKNGKPGLNGEIQLTDSMKILMASRGMEALTFDTKRFDAGDKLGYLKASVELALMNPSLEKEFRSYLKELVQGNPV